MTPREQRFAAVEEALEELRAGRMIVVVDDEDRENEGDLVIAAEHAGAEAINFMAKEGRGWICLALTGERCDELGLEQMARHNGSAHGTQFTVTIDAREGITTGISAADRARTVQVAVDPANDGSALVKSGHLSPLRAKDGGVLERAGHTEASVDLARLAGLRPAGVICEVMNDDGTMARVPELLDFCAEHELRILTIADLIEYRRRREPQVERVVQTRLPTLFGDFEAVGYGSVRGEEQHLALVRGEVAGRTDVLVRIHAGCLPGDVFHARACGCGERLDDAMRAIATEGRGVLLHLAREGGELGALDALRLCKLRAEGLGTAEAERRLGIAPGPGDRASAAQILADLGLAGARLLSDDPGEAEALGAHGLPVLERVPLRGDPPAGTEREPSGRAERMGELLGLAAPLAA